MSRPALAQMLRLSVESSLDNTGAKRNLSKIEIRAETTLGTVYVEAMRRYATHAGLMDKDDYPSPFGKFVFSNDAEFGEANTQWIMHYIMASSRFDCPAFWRNLVVHHMQVGNSFNTSAIADLTCSFDLATNNRNLKERTYTQSATAFVGTYSKEDAFGKLGLLKKEGDQYIVQEPEPPSVNVFAYALADHWNAVWKDRSTVDLREVTREDGPATLLFLNSSETDYYLAEMQEAELLDVHRRVPPYQVVRLWDSPQALLERLYD